MPAKKLKPQPATREKTCTICAATYTYPAVGSSATRHVCELCNALSAPQRKVLIRMAKRIQSLERIVTKLEKQRIE
jgi:hypothetical protein